MPASNTRALEKAQSLDADAIIFDLEDAVAPDQKDTARANLRDALKANDLGEATRLVRINALNTPWGAADVAALAPYAPDAFLLPKVNERFQITELTVLLDRLTCSETELWAMIETPQGVLNAQDIAQAPRMGGFVLGTNDLAKDLGLPDPSNRSALHMALQTTLMAARGGGILCVDGVYNAFRDADGFRDECDDGYKLGMDGKSLIHPSQIAIANEVFSPSAEAIDLAKRQIAAFEKAHAKGEGIAVLDGKIVENLHVDAARRVLARAAASRTTNGDA